MLYRNYSLKKCLLICIVILLSFTLNLFTIKLVEASDHPILYFFWGDGCPHCEKEKGFLKKLQVKYPEVEMRWFETWKHPDFTALADTMRQAYGIKESSVPMTFLGKWSHTGFTSDEEVGTQIEAQVVAYIQQGGIDAIRMIGPRIIAARIIEEAAKKNPGGWELYPATAPPRTQGFPQIEGTQQPNKTIFIALPFLKKKVPLAVDQTGLPLFTVVIGGLDGLNPCAMWVLSFLLTLVVYARSRSRILLIGGIFVIASGVIYFLFMAAWLNMFKLVRIKNFLTLAVGAVAVVMGLINCKDFFFFKKGVSLTIPESAQPKLFKKMRALVQTSAMPAVILGTIVLAITANTIELACTAGFPAIYTQILTLQKISGLQQYFYLIFYNTIYVVPLAIVVAVFAWKMGGRKLTEKEGRILKLVGGVLMLTLGIILLVKPQLLMFG